MCAERAPVNLASDFDGMPIELDVYAPERWLDDALFWPECAIRIPDLRKTVDVPLLAGVRRMPRFFGGCDRPIPVQQVQSPKGG